MHGPRTDLTGRRFGYLTAVRYVARRGWECRCDCGGSPVLPISGSALVHGGRHSCGCKARGTTHGLSKSGTYSSWNAMRSRCYSTCNGAAHYQARGIVMCDRWRDSFEDFLADMGERPAGKTLDRIDNDKGYFPGNCRWATIAEQAANRSVTRRISAFGEAKTAREWESDSRCVVKNYTVLARLSRGWDSETAMSTPVNRIRSESMMKRHADSRGHMAEPALVSA